MEVKVIGQMDNTIDHTFESANRVYDVGGVSPTINTCGGGGLQPKILEDKTIVAMRGRNPENPSDRTVGSPTEQRLEPNSQGICNTLTSVQKDNLVMEKVVIDDTYANRQPRVYEDYSPALRSEREGLKTIENVYDFYNNNLKSDGVCGTLTSACSHNGSGTFGVIESQNVYLSDKGKKYVCDPKRGMCTDINADVCQTLTAKGQSNWTGSFVSEDIERLEKSATIGSDEPTIIHLKNGEKITSNDDLAQYRIRKLTPLECWSLMNFSEEDFLSAKLGSREVAKEILETYPHLGRRAFTEIERLEKMSNTQLYKQAGNSIVKNVLVAIIGQMIPGKEEVYKNI